MAGDGAVEVLLGSYGDGHGENREGLQANVQAENGGSDCELMVGGGSDDTLTEPSGKKLKKADSWTRCWAWAAKALVAG